MRSPYIVNHEVIFQLTSKTFTASCLPTAIGSLPHTDVAQACSLVLECLPAIPVWPQLPRRDPLENMYAQFSAGFPGAEVSEGQVYVDVDVDLSAGLEQLYNNYLAEDSTPYALSPERAAGFTAMVGLLKATPPAELTAFKGHITGPISQGIQMTDRARRPILYDEVLGDAVAKHLRLVAAEQEKRLAEVCDNTIVFLDEPYLHAIGSAFIQLSQDQVIASLEEVFGGLRGLKGLHCCANTDWGMVMSTSVDIVNFDAYAYADSLALYVGDIKSFLRRGGILAWGIVPNDEQLLAAENQDTLVERLLMAMEPLVNKGIALDDLLHSSLITPCCGLGSVSVPPAEQALRLLASVSANLRQRFGLGD
jgi:hypothetical protein